MKKQKQKEVVMKSIVETTGAFGLINTNGEYIQPDRPTVVAKTQFVEQQIFKKALKVLAYELPDKAQDVEFLETLVGAEGDVKLAVAAYCAEFGIYPSGEKLDSVEYESATQRQIREKAENDTLIAEAASRKALKEQEDAEAAQEAERQEQEDKEAEEAERLRLAALTDDLNEMNKDKDDAGNSDELNIMNEDEQQNG